MFWAKYRRWLLLLVYIAFFGHVALWYHWGYKAIGHLGFGCLFGSFSTGLITAGTIFTLLVFMHALAFGGVFCGWLCHWGINQDIAAWLMKKCGIKPKFVHINSKLIPWAWFLIIIGQVIMYWAYSGFPTSLAVDLNANQVWYMVPRSILLICMTLIISGFMLVYLFGERAFCRSVCTFRLWFNWFERIAPHKLRQIKACGNCQTECTTICPMGVQVANELASIGHIKNPECIKCFRCVGACPNGVLETSFKKNDFHKEGDFIKPVSQVSPSIAYLQVALAMIVLILFGTKIGANISLSLGFITGVVIANALYHKKIGVFEISSILLITVGLYYKTDMNDVTSTVKGVSSIAIFMIVIKIIGYKRWFDFIESKGKAFAIPTLLMIASFAFAGVIGYQELKVNMLMHEAKIAFDGQDYSKYLMAMDMCVEKFPDKAGAYYNLGSVQLLQKEYNKSLNSFIKSLELRFNAGVAESLLQKISDGRNTKMLDSMVDHLAASYSHLINFRIHKFNQFLSKGEIDKAQLYIEEVIKEFPKDYKGFVALGDLKISQNKLDEAKKYYEQAYAISPDKAAYFLAEIHKANNQFDKAEPLFEIAVLAEPLNIPFRFEQGVNFACQRKFEKAIAAWKEIFKIEKDFKPAVENIKMAEEALKAKAEFEKQSN